MAENPTTTATPVTMPPLATEPLANQLAALGQELAGDLQIKLDGPVEQQVQQAMRELDVTDTNSIIFFGSKAQQQLTTISDTMLENVRTKDMGPAGNALNAMVAKLREIDIGDVDPTDRPGFFGRLFGVKSEVQKYLDKYEDVRGQIDTISTELEQHKTKMLTDIVKLDKLYDANLDYFRTLEVYIAAGRAKLKEIDEQVDPGHGEEGRGLGRRARGAEAARPARRPRRPGAPRARPAAHPPGDDAGAALDPAGAGERQVAGHQDQQHDRQHGPALAPAAGPGGHDLPHGRGRRIR